MFRSFCTCREARIITDIYFKGRIWEQKWINSNCIVTNVIFIFTCLSNCQFITAALSKIRHLWSHAGSLITRKTAHESQELRRVWKYRSRAIDPEFTVGLLWARYWTCGFRKMLLWILWNPIGHMDWQSVPHVVCGMAGSLTKTLVPLDVMLVTAPPLILVTAPPLIFAPASSALSKWRFKFWNLLFSKFPVGFGHKNNCRQSVTNTDRLLANTVSGQHSD
jgi:hypothetical protein